MECNILQVVYDSSYGGFWKLQLADVLPYKSIVWENKWQESGSSQFVFPRRDYILDSVQVGRFVKLSLGGHHDLHYIHSVKVTANEVWAYGCEAKELFKKCAVMQEYSNEDVSGSTVIKNAVTNYCGFSWIDRFSAHPIYNIGNVNLAGYGYISLFDMIVTVCKSAKAEFAVNFNETIDAAQVYISAPNDKSDVCRFATQLGNASDIVCTRSDISYCNKVYAIGTDGYIGTSVESDITGETYEAILDLRETLPKEDMSASEYQAALDNRAHMSLIARHETEKLDIGDIDTSEYNSVYYLGDVVSVDVPELDITMKRRVVAEKYTIEGNEVRLKLTLGGV